MAVISIRRHGGVRGRAEQERSPGAGRGPRTRAWVVAAVAAALATVLAGLLVTGIVGAPYGADDNGDGSRLTCPADLRADTPSRVASWAGGVVLDYRVVENSCPQPYYPTSRRWLLEALVPDKGSFDLRILAAAEIGVLGAVAGLGVFTLRRWGPRRGAAIAAVVILAALAPVMARFFLSPFSETAGLVGAVALLLGAAGLAAPGPARGADRIVSTVLVTGGALYGGLAKQANLPLVVGACAVLLAFPPFTAGAGRRAARFLPRATAAGLCVVLLAASAWMSALGDRWAHEHRVKRYTTHDMVLGAVAYELRESGEPLSVLGLPDTLRPFVGMRTWPGQAQQDRVPDWGRHMEDRADETRRRAILVVATHPDVAYRMATRATAAYADVDVDYLATPRAGHDTPKGPLREAADLPYRALGRTMAAAGGAAGLALLLGSAAAAPVRALVRRRRHGPGTGATATGRLLLLGSAAACTSLSLAVVSLLGDGYFELGKHLWLGAYFAMVSAGLFAVAAAGALLSRRRNA